MTALETIPFHGDNLLVAEIDGVPHIVLRPAFEAIGLDADRQIMNMKAHHLRNSGGCGGRKDA